MKEILVSLRCIHCGNVSYTKSEQLISPTLEPDIRSAILDGTFFTCTCQTCQKEYPYFHPCLYVDKEHDFMIYGNPNDCSFPKDVEMRYEMISQKQIAHDPSEMKELIQILESPFAYEQVMKWKQKLMKIKTQYRNIRFDGYENGTVFFEAVDENGIGIPLAICVEETYESKNRTL